MNTKTADPLGPDPTPWRHVDGERVADPYAPGSPRGGYTFVPREGYSDYPDRYISVDRRRQSAPRERDL